MYSVLDTPSEIKLMEKKLYYTAGSLPVIVGILASILAADFGYLLLTVCFLCCYIPLFSGIRKKYEKDLIQISDILEQLILGKGSPVIPENTDSLISKLQAQTVRIHAMVTKYNEKLLEEQEEVRRFLSEIAHQIRTPLTNMETYLDLLREQTLTKEEQITCIRAVEQSERKIKFLTESFISASRMEHRIIQIRKERQSLRETIAKSIFQVRKKAEEKHMKITLECSGKIFLPHDRNWLSEAVANLLDNSIKYSPEDSDIIVRAVKNEMFTQIEVRDFGMGISGDENQIFRRFYRGSDVKNQEGFGIGLYITREIVKQHEGFLKVKKEPDGTSISIFLPC